MEIPALRKNYEEGAVKPTNCQQILNYVWINEDPVNLNDNERPLCGVSLSDIDNALVNAKKYPDVQVNIWIDFSYLDPVSIFFVQRHQHIFVENNVTICDLNDIEFYQKISLFRPETKGKIYPRVDLARLIVIDNCFQTTDATDVFYSDLDVPDVKLNSDHIASALLQHGMIFGATDDHPIENGYMAFRKGKGLDFLRDSLLPETIEDAHKNLKGFDALIRTLESHDIENYPDAISIKMLPARGYSLPSNPLYIKNGIN